jgi:hypothetical protein
MSTLTIILLVYVILDIIVDIIVVIKLKSMGISLRSLAQMLYLHKHQVTHTYKENDDDYDDFDDLK